MWQDRGERVACELRQGDICKPTWGSRPIRDPCWNSEQCTGALAPTRAPNGIESCSAVSLVVRAGVPEAEAAPFVQQDQPAELCARCRDASL